MLRWEYVMMPFKYSLFHFFLVCLKAHRSTYRKLISNFVFPSLLQVITWFQNRRAKLKRDMEELKKDVETVKAMSQKSFLESVNELGILKKKATHDEQHHQHQHHHQQQQQQQSLLNSPSKWRRFAVPDSKSTKTTTTARSGWDETQRWMMIGS